MRFRDRGQMAGLIVVALGTAAIGATVGCSEPFTDCKSNKTCAPPSGDSGGASGANSSGNAGQQSGGAATTGGSASATAGSGGTAETSSGGTSAGAGAGGSAGATPTTCGSGCIYFVRATSGNDQRPGTSWDTAFATVEAGLAAAAAVGQCQVWVAAGTYVPGTVREATFRMREGVQVYGGFAGTECSLEQRDPSQNKTILSGEIGTAGVGDNIYHVVTGANNALMDGFTITAGRADNAALDADRGAGLFIKGTKPTIRNCVFTQNVARSAGGAIAILAGGSADISHCEFRSNSAGPRGETTFGGAIYALDSCFSVNTSLFQENSATYNGQGGAIYVSEAAPCTTTITASMFRKNNAGENYGGAIFGATPSSTTISNSIFDSNTAYWGGALNNFGEMSIANCTFSGNRGTDGPGGVLNNDDKSNTTIVNSILWETGSGEIYGNPSKVNISFSNVDEAGFTGNGNIKADPKLDANLRLSAGSPCIDTADDSKAPPTDIEGTSRVDVPSVGAFGTRADMGAFEFQP